MRSQEQYIQKLIETGVCDERGAAFNATADLLPNGTYGMCIMGVRGNILSIYDTGAKASVGPKMFSIPLKDIKNLIINSGFFAELIKGFSFRFDYNGFTYTFKNCYMKKQELSVIESEAKK